MTEAYDVAEIKARLLARMGEHAGSYPAVLESFSPRILARIADLWGGAGLDLYLDDLLLTDRPDRQGFPGPVATALLALSKLHATFGLAPKASGTGWATVEQGAREGDAGDK